MPVQLQMVADGSSATDFALNCWNLCAIFNAFNCQYVLWIFLHKAKINLVYSLNL